VASVLRPALAITGAAAFAVLAAATASGRGADSSTCSKAAARVAMARYHLLSDPQLPQPVGQLLCGAFAGPGSRGMAATSAHGVCVPFTGWAVFRYQKGSWRLVPGGNQPTLGSTISRAGTTIVEHGLFQRGNESICLASGKRSRVWHWNGSRLVADAWATELPTGTVQQYDFYSPDRKVWCQISKNGKSPSDLFCGTKDYMHSATLKSVVTVCHAPANDVCLQNWNPDAEVLGLGQKLTLNGFRCSTEADAVTCAAVATGKGFRISSAGEITRLGG